MLNTITFKNPEWVITLQEKAGKLLKVVNDFKEKRKSFLMNCAIIYMLVKIGLILLATFSIMVLLISSATPYLALEMSRSRALLFALPLTLIIMFKLYFVFEILITYERSRLIIKSAINIILLKGKQGVLQGVLQLKETLPAELAPLSLEKVRNH